jgi:hypothetical protein
MDKLQKLQIELWDMFKDVHGIRPRHWTETEWADIQYLETQKQLLLNIMEREAQ